MTATHYYFIKYQYGGNYLRNPKWPPYIESQVIVKRNQSIYTGIVKNVIENETEVIMKIIDNKNYREMSLANQSEYNYGVGYLKFYNTSDWKYVTKQIKPDLLSVTEEYKNFKEKLPQIDDDINLQKNIPYNQKKYINENYRPLLRSRKDNLFSDKKLDIIISSEKDVLISLDKDIVQALQQNLKSFKNITPNDHYLMINKSIAINNLITNAQDEINEGSKIISIIENNLKNVQINNQTVDLFSDLITKIDSGYVYITRKGADVQSKVTTELIPNLKYFTWQFGKPIEYHTLKYVIFQNNFQKQIIDNLEQKKEAEKILSLEYIIALQPKSELQYWCIKRLLMIWYSDPELEPIIKKIRVLINHYRADPYQEYNKINGIMPMILIYLDYGIDNAQLVISKLNYYFSLYIDDDSYNKYKKIYWENSHPSYFIKLNNLIYFSNGSIDLKLYIEKSLDCKNNKPINDIFDKNYKELLVSGKVLSN